MHSSDVEHPAVEVEADDVLDVLPPAEQASSVADLGVAGDRAHAGVGERRDERPSSNPVRTRCRRRRAPAGRGWLRRSPVFRAPACRRWPAGSRGRWAAEPLDRSRSPVGRPVVDHDDLQVGVVAGGQRPHGRDPRRAPRCTPGRPPRPAGRSRTVGRWRSRAVRVRRSWRRARTSRRSVRSTASTASANNSSRSTSTVTSEKPHHARDQPSLDPLRRGRRCHGDGTPMADVTVSKV